MAHPNLDDLNKVIAKANQTGPSDKNIDRTTTVPISTVRNDCGDVSNDEDEVLGREYTADMLYKK